MQRPGANNPPERPLLSAETGNSKIEGKNPRRNGLFLIGDGFRGSGRLVGGDDLDQTACSPRMDRTGLSTRTDFWRSVRVSVYLNLTFGRAAGANGPHYPRSAWM